MKHESVDRYSGISNFSDFDPRAKIIGTLGFICGVAFFQDQLVLGFSLIFTACLLAISGVPAVHIARRYAIALPFIAFASLSLFLTSGQDNAIAMFMRISASVLALILLVVTTDFFDLLKGLQSMKVPGIMISMLMFTYRYIFVFAEELERMSVARQARGYRGGKSFLDRRAMGTISNTAGMVLVRAYERGLRVHDSLRARGYDGEIRTSRQLKFRAHDCAMASAFFFMTFYLLFLQMGVLA
jgi:cobalt/nickel transport system permease protein